VRFGGGISVILFGATLGILQVQVVNALTPAEVAQQITVRIGGANTGSGVIIEHEGNNYTVVTNWHVVQEKGNYTVFTQDGKQYSINQIKQLPNVDLAVFRFTSNQNYQVAEKGDSDQITLGKNIYVAGFPQGTSDIQFLSGAVSSIRKNPENGYALVYAVNAFPGMSGGPIIDEKGKLVGIHGRAETRPDTNATTVLGIPLKTYLSLVGNIAVTKPVATTSTPKPQNTPTTKPVVTTSTPKPQNTPISSTSPSGNISNSSGKFVLAKTLIGHSSKIYNDGSIEGKVSSVAFSPDGKTLASGSHDATIKIWNVSTGELITTLKGHSNSVNSVAFSPDSKIVASGSHDKTVKIWNVSRAELFTTKRHFNSVNSVVFSPNGKTLASGSSDKTIKIWNVSTGQEITTFKSNSNLFSSVAFNPDGKTLASCGGDTTIKIWNVSTRQLITTLNAHSSNVNFVKFNPDNKTLASSSFDNTIKIWNVATWQEITTLNGHSGLVNSVTFSPDGKTLASGSRDNTIKIWNVAIGQEITTLKGHSRTVESVAFSPDGKTLASGSWDATIKIWKMSD
jgi:WD40 repeat protein